ncbi:MAG: cyclic nucleotide-binding domain-containing protein [Acidimicrobiia bacterium]
MTLKAIEQLLAEHEFFAGLEQGYLELLSGCGRNVHFAAEERIVREGDTADSFFVIRKGLVALEIVAPERGPVVLETLGDGEVLGWSWLFPPYRWLFDAQALESTSAVQLDGTCLRQKCDEDPRLGYDLMGRFAGVMQERLNAARLRLMDLYGHE